MRKSGFAAAAGLGSLVLLLTACGGSSGSSNPATTSTAKPGAQATSAALSNLPPGSLVLHVQKSDLGWVLALAYLHRFLRLDLAAGDRRQPGGEPS